MENNNYRIIYDKHFLVRSGTEPTYQGRIIDGLSVEFMYKYFIAGKECFFPRDGSIQPPCVYRCDYDKDAGYIMELNKERLNMLKYSDVQYTPSEYATIWYLGVEYPDTIKFDAALEIFRSNPEAFDFIENRPAQSLMYRMIHVSKQKSKGRKND